ncbi:GNAT family N-acetyltransferase [Pullulanibacillus sp. KACC 23026]|uniref:GNAT family N-acetyltransferase n=1 Tax=Pullulanibacillus sp. KACC 23026 TaxID=3028315 RepID=UPI0023B19AA6|nr:GNAT family N-acetyltransferase [Pullulanibacillus sp. KACC 23026]WEG11294.1 GNAT family N-acetyltransferase [Pullulanibacillus sp. KACC 23026]
MMTPVKKEAGVTLDFYKEIYKRDLYDYHLSEEHSQYTSLPVNALKLCEEDPSRYPIVILYNGAVAGFFVLHGWEGVQAYCDHQSAILIRGYSVKPSYQGKGIATKSLKLLTPFIKQHFPDKNEIILAVNHNNVIAQHVYKKSGFIDKGKRVLGRKGELYIFHKDL